jgi:ATP:ADP antiporter, AAA family
MVSRVSNRSAESFGKARPILLDLPTYLASPRFSSSTRSRTRGHIFNNLTLQDITITVLIQVFLTGRLMKWFGVGITLVLMPLLSAVGFAAIGFAPILTVLATFQILRRAAGFALLRPAREVLFTVLRREDKYKAKSLIDTFGYRLGDITGAWSYPLMRWFGLGLVGISWVAVPLGGIWCVLSIWLGRRQRSLAESSVAELPAVGATT